ncbi:MAG: hypothetical protein IPK13_21380 [Deltaproteobacteria bacterium]|nr:hypothetical protein [Deltaproteobacteria bacterium]
MSQARGLPLTVSGSVSGSGSVLGSVPASGPMPPSPAPPTPAILSGAQCELHGPLALTESIYLGRGRLLSLKLGICLVLVLNVLDGILTLVWVESGLGTEANPLLAGLMAEPVLFMIAKVVAVSLGVSVFWRYLARPISAVAVVVSNTVYLGVCLYHLMFLMVLLADI